MEGNGKGGRLIERGGEGRKGRREGNFVYVPDYESFLGPC